MPEILFFAFYGPSRRSDRRVLEFRLDFTKEEPGEFPQRPDDVLRKLSDAGILSADDPFPFQSLLQDRAGWYTSLLAQLTVLLQKKAGHQVDLFESWAVAGDQFLALAEHEHPGVGMAAAQLAHEAFGGTDTLAASFRGFLDFARKRLTPVETRAIIAAAGNRDIPCFQLEHEPLAGNFRTGPRVRSNGLLLLGHGSKGLILDGTFCVSRAGAFEQALLKNPGQRLALLQELGIPVDGEGLADNEGINEYQLLAINRRVTGFELTDESGLRLLEQVHPEFESLALLVSERLRQAPLSLEVKAGDLAKPLAESAGRVVDFNLAPRFDHVRGAHAGEGASGLLDRIAADLLDWLFPEPGNARMPVIAVTGTNGKTTTVRMINHILRETGRHPGMVCTEGIFLDGRQVSEGDAGAFIGHARALSSPAVDTAVLEAHHRGITVRGFAFDHCDVAVCLNVTEEHIKVGEIESIEEMTAIKRALVERAEKAAVLFADNENCLGMLEHITAGKICLVSLHSGIGQLRLLVDEDRGCYCVVESIEGKDWIIVYDNGQRLPLIPVDDIPATINGTAAFNVSNAIHAAAAVYLAGTDLQEIARALSTFAAGTALTPGRLNIYDELPFRVVLDFAHNPDGIQKICEFIDRQEAGGRKIIAFSGSAKRNDSQNRKVAQIVAGHFDFYFCKDYQPSEPPKRRFVAPLMQEILIEEGVPGTDTAVLTFGREVIFEIFDFCKPGDLLLLLVGNTEKKTVPGYIREYAAR